MDEPSLFSTIGDFIGNLSSNIWNFFKENPLLFFLFLLLLLLWLLLQFLRKTESESGSGNNSRSSSNDNSNDGDNETARHEQELKVQELGELAKQAESGTSENRDLAKRALEAIAKSNGLSSEELKNVMTDPKLLHKLAKNLDLSYILGYSLATRVDLPEIKATSGSERIESSQPTLDADMRLTGNPDDILSAPAEELADLDGALAKLQKNELPVITYYDRKLVLAILHMIVDVSGSMQDPMQNGIPKFILAQAVVHKLLARAMVGQAKFLLRFFDGGIHPLMKAYSSDEAHKLDKKVAESAFSGGGTDILNSLKKAVKDIKDATDKETISAEIVLITDGQDSAIQSVAQIQAVLGDVKLHVIIIGDDDNYILQKAATSYVRYN